MPQICGESVSIDPVLGHGRRAARDTDPFTQADARHLSMLLPFRQVPGIKNAGGAFIRLYPEE